MSRKEELIVLICTVRHFLVDDLTKRNSSPQDPPHKVVADMAKQNGAWWEEYETILENEKA